MDIQECFRSIPGTLKEFQEAQRIFKGGVQRVFEPFMGRLKRFWAFQGMSWSFQGRFLGSQQEIQRISGVL